MDITCKQKQNQAGIAIIVSNKTDFKFKSFKKRLRRLLYDDKWNNPTR